MNTKTVTIYSVPVRHADRMAMRAAGVGISLSALLCEMIAIAVREEAYVFDEGNCFSLVNAETGIPISGVCFYYDSDTRAEARRLAEVLADERGYYIWQHVHGEKIPPGMMTSGAPVGNE